MDLKEALWQRGKYMEYFDEISEYKFVKNDRVKEEVDMKIDMKELSKICYDITVDVAHYSHEETMVTIKMPYSNLRYLSVTNENKEEKKMAVNMLPAVEKVETYNNRVVKVTFIDGTFTKAVCSENDNFDLDVGITICAMKRLLGTNSDNATREYNRFINHAHDVMDKNEKEKIAAKAEEFKRKEKQRKAELKKAARKLKEREAQIEIQAQAIIRAHQEIEEIKREELGDDLK